MLSSKNRLKRSDFKLLAKFKKKIFSSENFVLKVFCPGIDASRFAVVVPATFSKKATVRNKIKRRTKAVIADNLENFKPGLGLVFYLKKEAAKNLLFAELKKELLHLFNKAGVSKC